LIEQLKNNNHQLQKNVKDFNEGRLQVNLDRAKERGDRYKDEYQKLAKSAQEETFKLQQEISSLRKQNEELELALVKKETQLTELHHENEKAMTKLRKEKDDFLRDRNRTPVESRRDTTEKELRRQVEQLTSQLSSVAQELDDTKLRYVVCTPTKQDQ